jgi:acyl-CoA synthetase (AMP-forming)/AMP-acid ligase II
MAWIGCHVAAVIHRPIMDSPYQAFVERAARDPRAPFLIAPAAAELPYARDGFRCSYGDTAAQVEAVKRAYAGAGYGHGARVGLLLENRPDFFVHWLALNGLGAAVVPINPDLQPGDLAHQLAIAEPDLVVALPEKRGLVAAAGMEAGRIVPPDGTLPRCRAAVTRDHGAPNDECALLFTSGTTGKPKGCVLSNFYFLHLARWYGAQGGLAAIHDGGEIAASPLPVFHMNALACSTTGMILKGGAVVPLDRFHAGRWWRSIAEAKATIIHYLGVMPAVLLKLPPSREDRAHQVRFGFGAGVDPDHHAAFEARFGFPLVEVWGMTEAGGAAVTTTGTGPRHVGERCIGRLGPEAEYRIVDDDGRDAPPGSPGEFIVRARGPDPRRGFFSGYLKDERATDEAWAGGWFHTGDVVHADASGLLFFVDRKKNIVRRSGENISVVEVESVLDSFLEIAAVAVAPVADEVRGEEVCALVRLARGTPAAAEASALAQDLVARCAERLAYFKAPGFIAFVDALPVTATQKLQRGETRALAARLVTEGGAIDLRAFKAGTRTRQAQASAANPKFAPQLPRVRLRTSGSKRH